MLRTFALLAYYTTTVLTAQTQDLQETKNVLESALNGQAQLSWVQTTTSTADAKELASVKATAKVSDSRVDVQSCVFTFRLERTFPDYRINVAWTVPFAEIDKVEVLPLAEFANQTFAAGGRTGQVMTTDTPVILVRIHAPRDKKFTAHRWSENAEKQVIERDEPISPAILNFGRQETAQAAAAALLRARDLCRERK